MEGLSWLMDLFGMELACLIASNELGGILKRGWPIETLPESLLD